MSLVRLVRGACAGLVMIVTVALPAAAQTDDTATITVVHAVAGEGGFPTDLYVDGRLFVSSMVYEAVSEPVEVAAGQVEVALFAAGADPSDTEPLLAEPVTLEANASYTAVAQLIEGEPAIALYRNDLDPVEAGATRLTVRHAGPFGPLQVSVGGELLIGDLMSPNEITVGVPAGSHSLLVATSDGSPLVERDLDFRAGSLLVLYAVGSADDDSFALLTQQVTTPQVTPTGVPTGTGGMRAQSANAAWVLVPLALIATAMVAVRPRRSAG